LKIKVAVDGIEIKSCLSLKGEFFLSVAGVTVVFFYGFKISLDFFVSFLCQDKNERNKIFFLPLQRINSLKNKKILNLSIL
jgi:hypothetical protein